MKINIKKFGTTLTSRQAGKEAFLAFQPTLSNVGTNEPIEVDFEGVVTFSPSWGDEFLTPLQKEFDERLTLEHTANPSVQATLELLEQIHKVKFTQIQ
jgi:hypothetical protein